MKKTNKLPAQKTETLYKFEKPAGFFETTQTSGDPTNTTVTSVTTTHIWVK